MKKCWVIIAFMLVLAGCGTQKTFETVSDVYAEQAMASMQQVMLELPEEAAVPVLKNGDTGKLYLCDGYTVTVQTFEAGDLEKTFREVTGFPKENLTVIQTQVSGMECYSCAWAAAGEGEEQVARTMILSDGNYHYAVTVMTGASKAGELAQVWQDIFDSVRVEKISEHE